MREAVRRLRVRRRITKERSEYAVPRAYRRKDEPETINLNSKELFSICLKHKVFKCTCGCDCSGS